MILTKKDDTVGLYVVLLFSVYFVSVFDDMLRILGYSLPMLTSNRSSALDLE